MPGMSASNNSQPRRTFYYPSIPFYLKAILLACAGTAAHVLQRGNLPTTPYPKASSESVLIANPIPDQFIQIGEKYTYDVSKVFSGDYLRVQSAGLPSWLNLEYKQLGKYSVYGGKSYDVAVSGDTAFVANYKAGLLILDISNLTSPQLLSTYPAGGGAALGIAVSKDTVFVANDKAGLLILDVSNLTSPQLLSTYSAVKGAAYSVAVSGNTAFVANMAAGLSILDVSDLMSPQLLSTYPVDNGVSYNVAVSGDTVFVANMDGGLVILNVSNLMSPQLLSTYSTADGACYGIAISGDTVFVANYKAGLLVLNVSNLTSPQLLSTYSVGRGYTLAVVVSGNTAFVANDIGGLLMLDVSEPAHPQLLGISPPVFGFAQEVVVSNNTVFVANDFFGLHIPDLHSAVLTGIPLEVEALQKWQIHVEALDLNTSLVTHTFQLTADYFPQLVRNILSDQSILPNKPFVLSIKSNQLFVPHISSRLRFLLHRVDNKALPDWLTLEISPILLNTYLSSSESIGVAVLNNTVFMANDKGGVEILDVNDPNSPKLLSTYKTDAGSAREIVISGSIAFVANYDAGLLILDISNLVSPQLLGNYSASDGLAYGIAVAGNIVFLANMKAGLLILNVSEPNHPRLLSTYHIEDDSSYDVAVSGNTVFVANVNAGLLILDVSDPTSPQLLSIYSAGVGSSLGVVVSGNTAFVANMNAGLLILNVSNPKDPKLISTYPSGIGFARKVAVSGNTVFIANYNAGLLILDVSDLNHPQLLGTYPVGKGITRGIGISDNTVFLASGVVGLHILSTSNWQFKISANPSSIDVDNYHLALTASDEIGGSVSIPFVVRVEGPPKLHSPITQQYVETGQLFSFNIPSDTFTDPNLDPLTLNLTPLNQTSLPTWLKFNEISATLFGTPTIQDRNILSLRLTVKDPRGQTAYTDFNLTVIYAPKTIPGQPISLVQNRFFNCTIALGTIFDSYGQPLSYGLAPNDGKTLPEWLSFTISNTALTLSGTPTSTTVGVVTLLVEAKTDLGYSTNAPLVLSINHNFPPQVKKAISAQTATVGEWFDFVVNSKEVFEDQNNDSLTYTASLSNGEPLPDWLQFIQDQPDKKDSWHFKGKPGGWDTNPFSFRMMTIQITACDTDNHSAIALFNLTVNGTSTLGLLLKVATPLLSAFGLFQKRASVLNRLCYKRREKPSVKITAGKDFSLPLSTPRNEIGKIEVKTRHIRPKGCKRFTDCQRFFKPPIHYLQLPYDSLPAGPLPPWMKYEEAKHTLEGTLPVDTTYRELMICVKDHNGIIQEHFIFNVDTVTAIPEENENFIPDHSVSKPNKSEKTSAPLELDSLSGDSGYLRLQG